MSSSVLPSSAPRQVIDVDALCEAGVLPSDVDALFDAGVLPSSDVQLEETQVVLAESPEQELTRCPRVPIFSGPAADEDLDACSQRVVYGDNDNAVVDGPVIDPTLAVVVPDTDDEGDEPVSTRTKRDRDSFDWDTDQILSSIVDSVPLTMYALAADTVEVGAERFAAATPAEYRACEEHIVAFLRWNVEQLDELLKIVLGEGKFVMATELGVDRNGFILVDGDRSPAEWICERGIPRQVVEMTRIRVRDGTMKHVSETETGDVDGHADVLAAIAAQQRYATFQRLMASIADDERHLRAVRHMKTRALEGGAAGESDEGAATE